MLEDLGDNGTAEGVDTIAGHSVTKERQPQAVSELLYHKPNQPFQQYYVTSYSHPCQDLKLRVIFARLKKKGNVQQCQSYRTSSLVSHPNKVMLKITLNRFKPQTEKIIAEEQVGLRAGRSTTEEIFNL